MEKSKNLTIGVFAPANSMSKIDKRLIDIGINHLNSLGFNVMFGEHVNNHLNYTAGTIEERVSDIHSLFENEDIFMLMAAYGGYNSNQLLDHIDYKVITENPKPIIGYSDITALLNGIYAKTGIPMLHGPSFISFCNPTIFPEFVNNFMEYMQRKKKIVLTPPKYFASDAWFLKEGFAPRDIIPHEGWHFLREGKCSGVLVGGNLETFISLIGTDYLPDLKNKILLLESVSENPAFIDRCFTQMRQAGLLKDIRGLIIGQFPQNSAMSNIELLTSILLSATDGECYPILVNTHFSHIDPIYTLPIGVEISIHSEPEPYITVENMFISY